MLSKPHPEYDSIRLDYNNHLRVAPKNVGLLSKLNFYISNRKPVTWDISDCTITPPEKRTIYKQERVWMCISMFLIKLKSYYSQKITKIPRKYFLKMLLRAIFLKLF